MCNYLVCNNLIEGGAMIPMLHLHIILYTIVCIRTCKWGTTSHLVQYSRAYYYMVRHCPIVLILLWVQPLASSPIIADPGSPYVATFQCVNLHFVFSAGCTSIMLHFYDSKQRPEHRATLFLSVRLCCITQRHPWALWQPLSGTRFSRVEKSVSR